MSRGGPIRLISAVDTAIERHHNESLGQLYQSLGDYLEGQDMPAAYVAGIARMQDYGTPYRRRGFAAKPAAKRPRVLDGEALHRHRRRHGRKYFQTVQEALYQALCGAETEVKLAARLRETAGDSVLAMTAAIALYIQQQMALQQELAVVLALVLVRKFARRSYADLCTTWRQARQQKRLSEGAEPRTTKGTRSRKNAR